MGERRRSEKDKRQNLKAIVKINAAASFDTNRIRNAESRNAGTSQLIIMLVARAGKLSNKEKKEKHWDV
uniref:Uncharacterized protein n=1 Tax=Pristionchus pacificus TaxID=54126 RepID=A0A2A6CX49_PRIPA|eukprot:PDM82627.1 hypothetical protein PRIPAC_37020 [Pristionchus pacificus]